jgi:hypothetical protein
MISSISLDGYITTKRKQRTNAGKKRKLHHHPQIGKHLALLGSRKRKLKDLALI